MYVYVSEKGLPSSVDFMRCESNRMVAGYTSANAYLFDIETSQKILDFDFKAEGMLHIMSVYLRVSRIRTDNWDMQYSS